MQNKKVFYLLIPLIIVGLLIFWFKNSNTQTNNFTNSSDKFSNNITSDTESVNLENDNKYVEYSNGVLEKNSEKRLVLFFYASWCPTCIPVNREIQENLDKIPENVVIVRVNYNDSDTDSSEIELAKKYGVTYQHTFVELDDAGNAVQKWNGGSFDDVLMKL